MRKHHRRRNDRPGERATPDLIHPRHTPPARFGKGVILKCVVRARHKQEEKVLFWKKEPKNFFSLSPAAGTAYARQNAAFSGR
jgi:hypothetical protein